MKIEPFAVEQWMNEFENHCAYNLAETCVDSLTVDELLEIAGRTGQQLMADVGPMRLGYGAIEGSEPLRWSIAALYQNVEAREVVVTHGSIGANALVYQALISPGDRVIAFVPTYQQHVSVPASLGADVQVLRLREENNFLPDLAELRALADDRTRLICFANPNNPTGSLMDRNLQLELVAIARSCNAYILGDEVYRGTDQSGSGSTDSIADVYERGISTGSMSKAFALAGLRLGWIAGPRSVLSEVNIHRDYNTISMGMIDDHLATMALENSATILARSRAITRRNLAILDDWIRGRPDLSYVKPSSGTTALVRYERPVDSRQFCRELLDSSGVLLTPGSTFDLEGRVRVGFANRTEILKAGLARIDAFLDN